MTTNRAIEKSVLLLIGVIIFLVPHMAHAGDFDGTLSVGIGGGFGDEKVAPGDLSVKYWSKFWEIGTEGFLDGTPGNRYDQFGLLWITVRYQLTEEYNNSTYMGIGGGALFKANVYRLKEGYVTFVGWDAVDWGFELKYGYFKPSIYSLVVYYHL